MEKKEKETGMRAFHKGVSARLVCVRVGIGWGGRRHSCMNIYLPNSTNKHIDPPSLYTVRHKKRQLALHLLRLARLKVVNGY